MPQVKNEGKYVGYWIGTAKFTNGKKYQSHLDFKDDLSFLGKIVMDGKVLMKSSGVWSVIGNSLSWTYLVSNPKLRSDNSTEKYTVKSIEGDELRVISKKSSEAVLYHRVK